MVFVAPAASRHSGGVDRDQPPKASGRADRVQGCVMLDMASPEIGALRFRECSHRFPQQFDSALQVLLPLGSVVGAGRSPSGRSPTGRSPTGRGTSGRGLGEYASRIVESAGLVRTKL
jgi:hypothetical protein